MKRPVRSMPQASQKVQSDSTKQKGQKSSDNEVAGANEKSADNTDSITWLGLVLRIVTYLRPWEARFWRTCWSIVAHKITLTVLVVLLSLTILIYVAARFAGYEPLNVLPAIPTRTPQNVPDLSGDWEYRCIANDGLTFDHGGDMHGGTVTIYQTTDGHVPRFTVSGKRMWIQTGSTPARQLKDKYVRWDSKSGSFITRLSIQFPYEATSKGTTKLQGFVQADVELRKAGDPIKMSGDFYYIKGDGTAILGTSNFRKMGNEDDLIWGARN